jgi:hypothetical protein
MMVGFHRAWTMAMRSGLPLRVGAAPGPLMDVMVSARGGM